MNKITIVYSYYNSLAVIPLLVQNWNSWEDSIKEYVTVIVVDDCSEIKFANVFRFHQCKIDVQIYEVLEDIKWNQVGAFNLGFSVAKTEWIMNMPVDRLIPNDTISKIINTPLDKTRYYLMKDMLDGKPIGCPHGIMLLTREAFIDCGRFDEDFCGNYGYDDTLFRNKLDKICAATVMECYLEVLPQVGHMHGLIRDTAANGRLLQDKISGRIPASTDICRFKWRKI